MPINVTIHHEVWRSSARWVEDCLKLSIPVQPNVFKPPKPFISRDAKPGMDQLLRKAKRGRDYESITLTLNWNQAQGLMDQLDS